MTFEDSGGVQSLNWPLSNHDLTNDGICRAKHTPKVSLQHPPATTQRGNDKATIPKPNSLILNEAIISHQWQEIFKEVEKGKMICFRKQQANASSILSNNSENLPGRKPFQRPRATPRI
ncbi:MAG: hypothetical protein CL912_33555 [Deltaproteobacteria bacterium]|nr:hypothetical protein [Deltaproteobacteria bacterium]